MHKLFYFTFLLISFIDLAAQDAINLAVDGTVRNENGSRVIGATVSLYQDGKFITKSTTGKNGRFDLFLDYNHEFIVEISQPGYVSKKLYFNTKGIPADEQLWPYEYGGFIIDMLRNIPEIDYSILDQPIGKIYFDPNYSSFTDDRQYTAQIRSKLDQLQKEYEQKVKSELKAGAQNDKNYMLAIRDAEAAMADGDLLTAKDNYLAASSLKPDETVPKNKILEIDKKLADNGKKEEQYLSLLSTADQMFGNEQYSEAKKKYAEASALKPIESYPKTRIAECDDAAVAKQRVIAEQTEAEQIELRYQAEIKKADEFFYSSKYQEAKILYRNALGLKANQVYPIEQLSLIEEKLAEIAQKDALKQKQADVDEKYISQIEKANTAFNSKQFEIAKELYLSAKSIKPSESYPYNQIALIDKELEKIDKERIAREAALKVAANQNDQARINSSYASAISEGDKAFMNGSLEQARKSYNLAASIKPNEQYPTNQLTVIENRLKEISGKQKEENDKRNRYNDFVKEGDRAISAKDWDGARSAYSMALELYPNETFPQGRFSEIDYLQKRDEDEKITIEFNRIVGLADKAFIDKSYESSVKYYQEALAMKSDDSHCSERLKKLHELINAPDEVDKNVGDVQKQVFEENFDEGTRKITIRKVVIGDKVDVYKRVVHNWGGKYYFLNEKPITELVWNKETTK